MFVRWSSSNLRSSARARRRRRKWLRVRISQSTHLDVDDATIQALCRWATTRSIEIYGRLSKAQYADYVEAAGSATFDSIQARTLWTECPTIDNDDRYAFLESIQDYVAQNPAATAD